MAEDNSLVKQQQDFTQKTAFVVLFDKDQLIPFQKDKEESNPTVRKYPFDKSPDGAQYFVLNPMKKHGSRQQTNIALRQGITVEQDCISLDLQRQWFHAILGQASVANFSGNKSIHFHIRFIKPLEKLEEKKLVAFLKKAFPFADWKLFKDSARLCRIPGAMRDNGAIQTIDYIGDRRDIAEVLSLLEASTVNIKAIPETANTFLQNLKDSVKYTSQESVIKGYEAKTLDIDEKTGREMERKTKYCSLEAALKNLLQNGYSLSQDTWEYKALAEQSKLAGLLSDAIHQAREAGTEDQKPAQTTKKPIAESGWIDQVIAGMEGNWEAWYTLQGISDIRPDNDGWSRGFPPGQHKNSPGFRFRPDNGAFADPYGGQEITGMPVDYLIKEKGLSRSDAWKELAIHAGIEPGKVSCKYCGQEIMFKDRKPVNQDGTLHRCSKKNEMSLPVTMAPEPPIELEAPQKKEDNRLDFSSLPVFKEYLSEVSGTTDAPDEFIAVSLLSAFAAAIGNKVFLELGPNKIRPNIWNVLVAESSTLRKTTAMNLGIKTLQKLNSEKREQTKQEMEDWNEQEPEERGPKPKERLNIYPTGATVERLIQIMVDKPDGLSTFSEMGQFLKNLEKQLGFKECLTNLYDAPPSYEHETKTCGKYIMYDPAPSIIGCSTLSWLQENLKDTDLLSGFLARFQFAVLRKETKEPIAIPRKLRLSDHWERLFRKLEEIEGELGLTPEAEKLYTDWFHYHRKKINNESEMVKPALIRLETCVHKYAIVYHCLEMAQGKIQGNKIGRNPYYYGTILAEAYFERNILDCYEELTQAPDYNETKIMDTVRKQGMPSNDGKYIQIPKYKLCQYSHIKNKELEQYLEGLGKKNYVEVVQNGKYRVIRIKKGE